MKIVLIVLGAGVVVVVSGLYMLGVYATYSDAKFMNESKFY